MTIIYPLCITIAITIIMYIILYIVAFLSIFELTNPLPPFVLCITLNSYLYLYFDIDFILTCFISCMQAQLKLCFIYYTILCLYVCVICFNTPRTPQHTHTHTNKSRNALINASSLSLSLKITIAN